jgi:hypothetical protein
VRSRTIIKAPPSSGSPRAFTNAAILQNKDPSRSRDQLQEREAVEPESLCEFDLKIIRPAPSRSSGLFVATWLGGLTHSPHRSRSVFVRPRPRSRVSPRTVPAAPTANASTTSHRVKLLIVLLLLKVLKLAATRITRQLAQ